MIEPWRPFDEEEASAVEEALAQLRVFRDLVAFTGRKEEASRHGWPHGDPSVYGGDWYMFFDEQLATLGTILGLPVAFSVLPGHDALDEVGDPKVVYVAGPPRDLSEENLMLYALAETQADIDRYVAAFVGLDPTVAVYRWGEGAIEEIRRLEPGREPGPHAIFDHEDSVYEPGNIMNEYLWLVARAWKGG